MSDHWIGIIPRDPHFIPSDEAIAAAEEYMANLAPDADEIEGVVSATVQFRDCGGNFIDIRCPICNAEISIEWWHEQMGDEDYWENGFNLNPVRTPCGHDAASLNELKYDWEQGFSRFILDTMNPNIGRLDDEQVSRLEGILGCPVKVIYQHI
jgi:hypothetical protein